MTDARATLNKAGSDAEELLAWQLKAAGVPFEREFQFAPPRKWRADFVVGHVPAVRIVTAALKASLLVEIDGGGYTGGRHSTGPGIERDAEKQSAAAIAGYRVLRCTPKQVESGECLRWIEAAR